MKLAFHREPHEYTMDGRTVPSVTQCLDAYYRHNEYAMQLGKLVHRTVELHELGTLDVEDLDPVLIPYYEAYLSFKENTPLTGFSGIYDIKTGSHNPYVMLQLAAQWNLVRSGRTIDGRPVLESLQLNGKLCEVPMFDTTYHYGGTPDIVTGLDELCAVYLQDNGTYKVRSYNKDRERNFAVFLHALGFLVWKKENNV